MEPVTHTGGSPLRDRRLDGEPILDDLAQLVPADVLQNTQDVFSSALNVPILFLSPDGSSITKSNSLDSFCWHVTHLGKAQAPCTECNRLSGIQTFRCPMDIRDVILPINAGDSVVGYLIASEASSQHLEELTPALTNLASLVSRLANGEREGIIRRIHDPLTGLANRAHFWHCLAKELDVADSYNYPVSLVLVDLDDFKRINDVYGHEIGDHVLKSVGELLKKETRTNDLACRYNSDAFLVMLRCADQSGADIVAWRLKNRIADIKITARGQLVPLAASVGQLTYPMCAAREPDAIFKELSTALVASSSPELRVAS